MEKQEKLVNKHLGYKILNSDRYNSIVVEIQENQAGQKVGRNIAYTSSTEGSIEYILTKVMREKFSASFISETETLQCDIAKFKEEVRKDIFAELEIVSKLDFDSVENGGE